MLRLAVATDEETLARMRDPLAERGIAAEHVASRERTLAVTDPGAEFADFDVGFVYPPRLMEGGAVDALLSVPWVNDREAILTSRNKGGVVAALSEAGLPVPRTVMVSNPADEAAVVDAVSEFSFPVVVKPNSATRGIGVAKAHDLDSLLGIVDYPNLVHDFQATGDRSYLIQEFLPDARDYRAMIVDGEYAGAVERRLPDAAGEDRWKHNVHRGARAEGVRLSPDRRALAERVAAVLDVDYLGVDLLVTDERTVVSETNARPTIDAATKYEPGFYDRLAGLIRRTAETT
jgi:ribosomal protein S6--L-glutamate ligase